MSELNLPNAAGMEQLARRCDTSHMSRFLPGSVLSNSTGFYVPETASISLEGMLEGKLDPLLASQFFHEYIHHLQFCTTTAGLAYQHFSVAAQLAIVGLTQAFRYGREEPLIPPSLSKLLYLAFDDPDLAQLARIVGREMKLRNRIFGWPYCADKSACPQYLFVDSDLFAEEMAVGFLLLAECQARIFQVRFLHANEKNSEKLAQVLFESGDRTDLNFVHNAIRYSTVSTVFVKGFGGDRWDAESLLLWVCTKAMMPPVGPFVRMEDVDEEVVDTAKTNGQDEPIFPGRRFEALQSFLVAYADKAAVLRYIENNDYDGLDTLICNALGWMPTAHVVDELEKREASRETSLQTKIRHAAVECHRAHPNFLAAPQRSMGELTCKLPAFSWMLADGSIKVLDWCTADERAELETIAVCRELANALERARPLTCKRSDCCVRDGLNNLRDCFGHNDRLGNCHLDSQLQSHCFLALRDFEAAKPQSD